MYSRGLMREETFLFSCQHLQLGHSQCGCWWGFRRSGENSSAQTGINYLKTVWLLCSWQMRENAPVCLLVYQRCLHTSRRLPGVSCTFKCSMHCPLLKPAAVMRRWRCAPGRMAAHLFCLRLWCRLTLFIAACQQEVKRCMCSGCGVCTRSRWGVSYTHAASLLDESKPVVLSG